MQEATFTLPSFLEAIPDCHAARRDVVQIGEDLKPPKAELRNGKSARKGNGTRGYAATTVRRMGPVGEACSSAAERPKLAATEQLTGRGVPDGKRESRAGLALLLPSSKNILGVTQRWNKVARELEPAPMFRVMVGLI